jgi:glycosyltransferase involved in cell wall biosynthesis
VHAFIDAAALGSGRGGDETFVRGWLKGLAAHAGPDDRFGVLVRNEGLLAAVTPALTGAGARFRAVTTARGASGVRHFTVGLPLRLAQSPRPEVVWTQAHAPVWSPAPVILSVADVAFLRHPEHYRPTTRTRLRALVPLQARRAAAVHTVSEFSRQEILEFIGLDEERVVVVPPAVEAPATVGPDDAASVDRELADAGLHEPFVLYLGNLHPRKNVARLIDAFADAHRQGGLAGHQLAIAGARWWGGGAEQEAARRAPPGSVVFLGRVSEPTRCHLLARARLLAFVSLYEGFGLPPVEAMAAGTPVLAASAGSLPEILGDAALFVVPTDCADIAAGLARLAHDDSLRQRLVPLGRARAGLYSVDETGRRAYALLHQVATNRTGALLTR